MVCCCHSVYMYELCKYIHKRSIRTHSRACIHYLQKQNEGFERFRDCEDSKSMHVKKDGNLLTRTNRTGLSGPLATAIALSYVARSTQCCPKKKGGGKSPVTQEEREACKGCVAVDSLKILISVEVITYQVS